MTNPVEELLVSKRVRYTHSGRDFLTTCLNPEHNDSNPSFRIDQTTGIAHCFSCGYKTNLFKHFGVFSNHVSIKVSKLKDKLKALSEVQDGLPPIKGAKPIPSPFRGISVATMKAFDMFYTDLDPELEDRYVFPIKDIRDKVTAYVGRHCRSDGNPRYMVRPEHASVGLYPARVNAGTKSIVLVEGMFDLLNMYEHGARNVVCTFGTSKLFNDTAKKLMAYKVMGVEKVFILYDGDDAGRAASEKLKPLVEEAGFLAEVIKLPDGEDPGSLDAENIRSIIEYTK